MEIGQTIPTIIDGFKKSFVIVGFDEKEVKLYLIEFGIFSLTKEETQRLIDNKEMFKFGVENG